MELGRHYIRPEQRIEKNCIVFDLDGFSLSNMVCISLLRYLAAP
jgi:hypothetical protein